MTHVCFPHAYKPIFPFVHLTTQTIFSKYKLIHLSPTKVQMPTVLTQVLTGAAFGAALTLSGVYTPSVIISQMQLRNFHMLQTFLTASASSVYIPPSSFSYLPPDTETKANSSAAASSYNTPQKPAIALRRLAIRIRSLVYPATLATS
jgi:hypothetical protein